jgi:hypothetical protein
MRVPDVAGEFAIYFQHHEVHSSLLSTVMMRYVDFMRLAICYQHS